jgi:hypothetical protein
MAIDTNIYLQALEIGPADSEPRRAGTAALRNRGGCD